jgi:hypothetical protein
MTVSRLPGLGANAPTAPGGNRAYHAGLCKTCEAAPYRPGGTECEECFLRRRRVEAMPTEAPHVDRVELGVDGRDHTAVLEVMQILLDATACEAPQTCPVCHRKTPKDVGVHAMCKIRLLAELAGRPFSAARNQRYQSGCCSVCFARPAGGVHL